MGLRQLPLSGYIGNYIIRTGTERLTAKSPGRGKSGPPFLEEENMPANLLPAYFDAEKKFRDAKGPENRMEALEEMLTIVPKHKGTDKLRADPFQQLEDTLAVLAGLRIFAEKTPIPPDLKKSPFEKKRSFS
jgi:hypothetical protein